MNPHYLSRIRYQGSTAYQWQCACGHVAESRAGLDAHVTDPLKVTPNAAALGHILILTPGVDVMYCGRCYGAWASESAAEATPCEVTP